MVAEIVVKIADSIGVVVTSVVDKTPNSVEVPVASDVKVVVEVLDSAGMPVALGSEIVAVVSDSTGISDLRVLVGVLHFVKVSVISSTRVVVKPPYSTGVPGSRVEVSVSVSVPVSARTPAVSGSVIVVDVGVFVVGVSGSVGTQVCRVEVEVLGSVRVLASLGSGVAVEFSDSAGPSEASSPEAVAEAPDPM